jgi:hypothetical protein
MHQLIYYKLLLKMAASHISISWSLHKQDGQVNTESHQCSAKHYTQQQACHQKGKGIKSYGAAERLLSKCDNRDFAYFVDIRCSFIADKKSIIVLVFMHPSLKRFGGERS